MLTVVISQNHLFSFIGNGNVTGPIDDSMYEEDIANDMRELELKLQEELEEQEKRWSSEDDSNK